MAQVHMLQSSFASGELSPLTRPRVDIEKWRAGCRRLRNFIVHPQGAASNRPGFRFVCSTKYPTQESIVQEYIFNTDQTYILEIGDEYIRFITNGAQVNVDSADVASWSGATAYEIGDYVTFLGSTVYYAILAGTNHNPFAEATYWTAQTIYEIPSPYLEADLQMLRFESSADTIFVTHPDYQTRLLQRFGATDWRFSLYEPDDGPFMAENAELNITLNASAVEGSITLNSTYPVFDSGHVGALFKLRHYVPGQVVSSSFSGTGTSSSISCFTTWRIVSHGTWTGKFRVEKSTNGGTTWTELRSFTGTNDINYQTFGTESIETNEFPFLVRINMYAYTSGTANIDLTTDAFYQDGIARVTSYTSSITVNATTLQDFASTAGTTSWAEGAWSEYRGFPAVSKFYQDRLGFFGSYAEPDAYWFSETSNYFSFVRHTSLLDTDAIVGRLPALKLNAINGAVALTKMIVLTSAMEWSIGPGSNGVFSANGYEVKPEGYRGSSGVDPVVVGDEVIFAQANGKTVRNLGFNLASDNFTGSRMSILAEHFFNNYQIVDMAYQQDPDSIVYFVRSDGRIITMTYVREQDIVGFTELDTGLFYDEDNEEVNQRDYFENSALIPNPTANFDELYVTVSRENGRTIERSALRLEAVDCGDTRQVLLEDQVFLDSAVSYGSSIDVDSIDSSGGTTVVTTAIPHGLTTGQIISLSCAGDFDGRFRVQQVSTVDNVVLNLEYEGTHGSTTIEDTSQYEWAVAVTGVSISTTYHPKGASSGYFPNTNPHVSQNYLTIVGTSELLTKMKDNTTNVTFETYYTPTFDLPDGSYVHSLIGNGGVFGGGAGFEIAVIDGGGAGADGGDYFLSIVLRNAASSQVNSPAFAINLGTTYHFAIVKELNVVKVYVNSVLVTTSAALASNIFAGGSSNTIGIGSRVQGYLDRTRITNTSVAVSDFANEHALATQKLIILDAVLGTPVDSSSFTAYAGGGFLGEGTYVFTDLGHLEGQTVGILADGTVLDRQVVSGGQIETEDSYANVHVGLMYNSDFMSLPAEIT